MIPIFFLPLRNGIEMEEMEEKHRMEIKSTAPWNRAKPIGKIEKEVNSILGALRRQEIGLFDDFYFSLLTIKLLLFQFVTLS